MRILCHIAKDMSAVVLLPWPVFDVTCDCEDQLWCLGHISILRALRKRSGAGWRRFICPSCHLKVLPDPDSRAQRLFCAKLFWLMGRTFVSPADCCVQYDGCLVFTVVHASKSQHVDIDIMCTQEESESGTLHGDPLLYEYD